MACDRFTNVGALICLAVQHGLYVDEIIGCGFTPHGRMLVPAVFSRRDGNYTIWMRCFFKLSYEKRIFIASPEKNVGSFLG